MQDNLHSEYEFQSTFLVYRFVCDNGISLNIQEATVITNWIWYEGIFTIQKNASIRFYIIDRLCLEDFSVFIKLCELNCNNIHYKGSIKFYNWIDSLVFEIKHLYYEGSYIVLNVLLNKMHPIIESIHEKFIFV